MHIHKIIFGVLLSSMLFACTIAGFAQTQELLATNVSADKQPAAEASNDAVEKPSVGTVSKKDPTAGMSQSEVSKEIANPLSNLWLLQFQQNNTMTELPLGKGNYFQSNLQFQPLLPIHISKHWNWVTRPVIQTFNSQPYPVVTGFNQQTGTINSRVSRMTSLGDTILATAISPDRSLVGNWLLAAGTTFIFPTGTHHVISQDATQAGPTVAVGYTGKKWLTFVFPQHWWKISGSGNQFNGRAVGQNGKTIRQGRTNQTLVLYNFTYNFDNGWSLGTFPSMFINWEAPRDQRLAFPIGPQVGKLLHAGPMPVKVDLQANYYVVRPTNVGYSLTSQTMIPKWNFQLQVTPVIPAPFRGYKPPK